MNNPVEQLAADSGIVRAWLSPRFDAAGLVSVCCKGNWTGIQTDDLNHAVAWILDQDRAGVEGIYCRVTTVNSRFPLGTRGSARDSVAMFGLWSDIDFGNSLHKAENLPASADEARDIPRFGGLPEATREEHSGGGLYHWHEFDRPVVIGKDITFDEAVEVSSAWQSIYLSGAKRMGVGYGTGVKDLARVLRVPGTINRKPGRPQAMCRVVRDGGPRYSLEQILELAARLAPKPTKRTPPPVTARPERPKGTQTWGGRGPMEILGDHACCGEILEYVGATYAEQYPGSCSYCGSACQRWYRPGWADGCSRDGVAVHKGGAAVTIRTDNFPGVTPSAVGHVLSPGQLFAALHHGGNESEASRDIIRAAHGRAEASSAAQALPVAVLDDVRQATAGDASKGQQHPGRAGQTRTYVHPARRLRALVTKVAGADGADTAGLLQWAARNGFEAGREANVAPKAVADAFRKAAVRAGLDNELAMTIIRASYREAGK
ncbi:hypothetical protein EDD90_7361 [Streptomyces sp. Ag109_O5-1]|uniref:hypothetical protein n=1 Tax=Streptomyces sp. Ag109_O5-1 TaxID=1938851 RepID=UPI000F4EFBD0|nr:hypothetical protein [Streptomyces sp. Ag109_O5-1]RPE44131.1 hypothetical protein EDD90_7361 [Streptomyces sp. Ag109_O5-1]